MILKGSIFITTDINNVINTINMLPDVRIINLAEYNEMELDPRYFVPGTVLLPPVEALIAEVDGDEDKYNHIYYEYLKLPHIQEYMASIIAFLYMGGKLLLYYPDSEYNNTLNKLIYFIMNIYGIGIGIVGENGEIISGYCYNADLEYFQLDLIFFYTGIISWKDYLYLYPSNLVIPMHILNILMNQIRPYGDNLEEKINVIQRIRFSLNNNKDLINPIQAL